MKTLTEDQAHDLVRALCHWREEGAGVWHPHMLAVWEQAICAVNDLKVKLHIEGARMADRAIVTGFHLMTTVLTDVDKNRYLVIDAIGDKVRLVRIPEGMTGADFGQRFYHAPAEGDPARATLQRE